MGGNKCHTGNKSISPYLQNATAPYLQNATEEAVESRDVLAEHRKKNRANRPPKEQQLLDAAHQQLTVAALDTMSNDGEDGYDEDSDSDESQRARRHSKSKREVTPKCLAFYEGSWREALKMAKLRFRRYVMLYNGFPILADHLPEAAQIIARVVEDMKQGEDHVIFDKGKHISNPFALAAYIQV
jgi:hypothetical protein